MLANKPAHIVFGVPNYGALWAPAVTSWLRVIGRTSREMQVTLAGSVIGAGISDRMYTHSAENTAVRNFLDIPEATHLFLTEADMILPDDCILKLLAMDKDIASGVYFLRGGAGQACIYVAAKLVWPGSSPWAMTPVGVFPTAEPFKADCFGLGCVLIKREVFDRVAFPWFDLAENQYGSDIYFYTKVKKAGIEVWGNPDVLCDQIEYTMTSMADYKKRLEGGNLQCGFILQNIPPK